jgi:hypothetical protein
VKNITLWNLGVVAVALMGVSFCYYALRSVSTEPNLDNHTFFLHDVENWYPKTFFDGESKPSPYRKGPDIQVASTATGQKGRFLAAGKTPDTYLEFIGDTKGGLTLILWSDKQQISNCSNSQLESVPAENGFNHYFNLKINAHGQCAITPAPVDQIKK